MARSRPNKAADHWTAGRVQALLDRRQWRHEDLADLCGVDRTTVTKWVTGEGRPGRAVAVTLDRLDRQKTSKKPG